MDEADLDVVPLNICGILLGIPYLYDNKAVFYREENKYQLFKHGEKIIIRAHRIKTNLSRVSTGHMKKLVRTNNKFILMMVNPK